MAGTEMFGGIPKPSRHQLDRMINALTAGAVPRRKLQALHWWVVVKLYEMCSTSTGRIVAARVDTSALIKQFNAERRRIEQGLVAA